MTLRDLFEKAEAAWPFDVENYPSLPHLINAHRRVAYTSHTLMHTMKQAGKLAALFEPMAHSPMPSMENKRAEVARQIGHMLVNMMRLAQLAGVTPEQVEEAIETYCQEQRRHS